MKFLFHIYMIIKTWLLTNYKYSLTIMIAMTASFLAIFFIAIKSATENLESIYMEKYHQSTYTLDPWYPLADGEYYPDDYYGRYPEGGCKADHTFFNNYLSTDLPFPYSFVNDGIEWSGQAIMYITEVNGESPPAGVIVLQGEAAFSNNQDKYMKIMNQVGFDYYISEGRDYSQKDLVEKNNVLVVSDTYGLNLGDIVTCHNKEFRIIGLIHSDKPGYSGYSRIPFWFADMCMQDYKPYNNVNISENAAVSLECYDAFVYLNRFTFEHPLTRKQMKTLSDMTGIKSSMISSSYASSVNSDYASFAKTTIYWGVAFGVFCMVNLAFVMYYLCKKNYSDLKIFKMYGATNKNLLITIVGSFICIALLAIFLGCLLSYPSFMLYKLTNDNYEWRTSCVIIAAIIIIASTLLAAIPMSILVIKRPPAKNYKE